MCTADAAPHTYVVAYRRDRLPVGPFWLQLGPEDPPGGVPGERTIVEVDLSAPGAVAAPGEVHPAGQDPDEGVMGPGDFIEPGMAMTYRQKTGCGLSGWDP